MREGSVMSMETKKRERVRAVAWVADEHEADIDVEALLRASCERSARERGYHLGDRTWLRRLEPHDPMYHQVVIEEGYVPPECHPWVGEWQAEPDVPVDTSDTQAGG